MKNIDNSEAKAILVAFQLFLLMLLFANLVPAIIFTAWVAAKVWNMFAAAGGYQMLKVAHTIGPAMVISYITVHYSDSVTPTRTETEKITQMLWGIARPYTHGLLTLAAAYAVSCFI